jgi:hypothetical protein
MDGNVQMWGGRMNSWFGHAAIRLSSFGGDDARIRSDARHA